MDESNEIGEGLPELTECSEKDIKEDIQNTSEILPNTIITLPPDVIELNEEIIEKLRRILRTGRP